MAECLIAQAHICDQIASECWNEEMAITFEGLARECNDAASVTRANGDTGLLQKLSIYTAFS